jgi:hypothetical protein
MVLPTRGHPPLIFGSSASKHTGSWGGGALGGGAGAFVSLKATHAHHVSLALVTFLLPIIRHPHKYVDLDSVTVCAIADFSKLIDPLRVSDLHSKVRRKWYLSCHQSQMSVNETRCLAV